MSADLPFFDTSYLVRFYLEDSGFEAVRKLAGAERAVAAAWHARAETVAALKAFDNRPLRIALDKLQPPRHRPHHRRQGLSRAR